MGQHMGVKRIGGSVPRTNSLGHEPKSPNITNRVKFPWICWDRFISKTKARSNGVTKRPKCATFNNIQSPLYHSYTFSRSKNLKKSTLDVRSGLDSSLCSSFKIISQSKICVDNSTQDASMSHAQMERT